MNRRFIGWSAIVGVSAVLFGLTASAPARADRNDWGISLYFGNGHADYYRTNYDYRRLDCDPDWRRREYIRVRDWDHDRWDHDRGDRGRRHDDRDRRGRH